MDIEQYNEIIDKEPGLTYHDREWAKRYHTHLIELQAKGETVSLASDSAEIYADMGVCDKCNGMYTLKRCKSGTPSTNSTL